ncbi:RNA-binding transcriptional accessory protein [Arenicella chitinivorans]|uniref:RNA-binding transcriptional accessory protein n=1 Tax=Arenicella chitinivorans TaxID=1329800 RepID=A0A918RS88_9GAMM|nr:Tex family protein [Arenicella chitinivorans]GHA09262.1 RNA-binding transcriptional accessory protein [Arenicella chitinivorans]
MKSIESRIADELRVAQGQVIAAIGLLDEGATVPFISRYRKEVTGGLDDSQLRELEDRLKYLRELEDRRATILSSIEEQGKLNDDLKKSILTAETKNSLEDLYLPYKPKRRTKGQIAREAGLEPLADALLGDPMLDPETEAAGYLNDSDETPVPDTKAALDGARAILMERFAEDAALLARLRDYLQANAVVTVNVAKDKEQEGSKFRDYFDYQEPFNAIPPHRALAIFRGRNEGILNSTLDIAAPEGGWESELAHPCAQMVAEHWGIQSQERPADKWLTQVVSWTWKIKVLLHLSGDLMFDLRERAEAEAIRVFSLNLKDLLLAAPAGAKATLGLDPGLRTGVKVAVVDKTGQYLDQATIYPHAPKNQWDQSIAVIAALAAKHGVELIAIGNGTASRETDKLAGDLIKRHPELRLTKVMVNEAGASVYSASEFAAREFPDLDVTIRGAVSIARRLQDPLAELVKIEPKSIGVGQYQHDVNQFQLGRSLDAVIEDCVNDVGVDLNMASMPLLRRVSGLNETIANNIVMYRNQHGEFNSREQLKEVPRLGDKTFEQAAGFLRIVSTNANPLDSSGVHPEAYSVVEAIARKNGREINSIIGDTQFLKSLKPEDYTTEQFGVPTVTDIINELNKPGRDPRPEFKTAALRDGVETIKDLVEDMVLEGTVTNVTNFGAFVDIGVHQDGLVHISCLADKFVDDPHKVVKAGQIVKVKVLEVDVQRKRIALTMRLQETSAERRDRGQGAGKPKPRNTKPARANKQRTMPANNAMAEKLAAAFKK